VTARVTVAGLIVCVALLVVPPAQASLGPGKLLARYEPVAVLNPEELFHVFADAIICP
jgi:hypothetical protein